MENNTIQLLNYNRWANNRVLNHLKELPDEVYDREIKSVFSSVEEVIGHMYLVDGMWLSVISGDPLEETMKVIEQLREESIGKELDEMREQFTWIADKYDIFINGLPDPDEVITIEHPQFGKMDSPISALVQHVVNHGTYHRGNITAMLRQQGEEGVPTDFVFYLYEE